MKTDIDSLMQQNDVDALLVVGPGQHNPAMVYLTGGGHFNADLFKKRGEPAVLFAGVMERDEAAKSGLTVRSYSEFPIQQWAKEANGDRAAARLRFYKAVFEEMGITGRVAIYGQTEIGPTFDLLSRLEKEVPGLTFWGDSNGALITQAMATKTPEEIERIRKMGQITVAVVDRVKQFLSAHKAKDNRLVKADGSPLKLGEVKSQMALWLAEHGVETPEDTIFSIGRDAGVPHSSGNPDDDMELGKTIIFDIFPAEAGGGYFYDFTRTWCLGYAPDDVQALYDNVRAAYDQVMAELKSNTEGSIYQALTCRIFTGQGHPTVDRTPGISEGYIHSLGHGVGLNIHEKPNLGMLPSPENLLVPGSVFTVEPGLYYPERGMGVRLEDTVYVRPDGGIEVIAPYPLDLIVPVG